MREHMMAIALAAPLAMAAASLYAEETASVSPSGPKESELDRLAGQPAEISPWAYAWRADRQVQDQPEAYFIPHRLERIDKVYRTAIQEMPADQLRSKYYDMPDLITPLPPPPKGRLLAGLLWTVSLADYQVELHWRADAEAIPSPEAVEVRVYPTAFGWFGWCKDEILSKPEISADGRTWTYKHPCPVEPPAAVGRAHRSGAATEMVAVFCDAKAAEESKPVVPSIHVISPTIGTWKRMDVEIEWGFQPGSEKADFDGRLDSYVSLLGPVTPLSGDTGTTTTGGNAWQSRATGGARRGIILPLLYVPGDRPPLDCEAVTSSFLRDTSSVPYVPSTRPTLDSRVTVWSKTAGFTFRPRDLDRGSILIPEHGVFITKSGSGKTGRTFAAELAAAQGKSVRRRTRERREVASWDELMQQVRLWTCPPGTPVPPFPGVEDPPMQVELSDARWTDAWRAASIQLRGKHMWGGLAFEVGRVAHEMDLVGLHDEADKVYQHFLKSPGAKSDGDYCDGTGALEYATGMRHDMGYDHDGTHASTGRVLFAMADRYFLTGDKEWFQRHRDRMQAAADWIIRQRNSYMKDIPNRQDLLVAGLMPPCMLGDYAIPSCEWRWFYADNAYALQGLQRFADALAEADPEAAKKYQGEAQAFRADLRRTADREAALSPVRLGPDGAYHSFLPGTVYTRGTMLALEYGSFQRPQTDTIIGALPLAEPFVALDPNDPRIAGTIDVMEETGTSPTAVRRLEEARKQKGASTDDAWFWNTYAGLPKCSHTANTYLLQDDVPNFLRFWMNAYAAIVGADGKMWEWYQLDAANYGDCTAWDHGTAGWFLEHFRNLLVMEQGQSLWIARATPRAWLEQGKKIAVKNAPTYFGPLAYEIVSDVDHGRITGTLEIPSRRTVDKLFVRFRHPQASPIKSVMVNGKPWKDFDPAKEVICLDDVHGTVTIETLY